jgi:hypothetical protein
MRFRISIVCLSFFAVMLFSLTASGQIDASSQRGDPRREELPKNIKESLAKQRIAREKKEYEELLRKSEEAVVISEELEKSFTDSNQLSAEDRKKLDRLERLVKKIRSDLGGDDDGEKEVSETENAEKPSTIEGAFKTLQANAAQLFSEIKKSTRYSVSVVAIQTSNTVLKLLKFIRFGK